MTALRRLVVVLIACFCIFLPFSLFADDKASEEKTNPLGLELDGRAALQLQAAADYLQDQDWKSAVRLLQDLLDGKAGALARLAGREGRADRYVRVGAEAERLLAGMPEAGRQVYRQMYGPAAEGLLKPAAKDRDAERLTTIVRRYLYTEAGAAALRELASVHYKAGRLSLAARCYAKLLEHLGPARWTSDELHQASVAFHHREASAVADRVFDEMLARQRQDLVRQSGRKRSAEELRQEVARAAAPRRGVDWPVYRGDAARAAQAAGGLPYLSAIWRRRLYGAGRDYKGTFEPTSDEEKHSAVRAKIEQAETWLRDHNQPLIPAFSPITVMVADGEKKTPLLLYKNYWGIAARNLKDGRIAWASPSAWSLERMLGKFAESDKSRAMSEWLNSYLGQNQYPQILFENSTTGTLSTDGRYVYAVEDLAVPPAIRAEARADERMRPRTAEEEKEDYVRSLLEIRVDPRALPKKNPLLLNLDAQRYGPKILDAIRQSRLHVFDLKSNGKLVWELGGEQTPLSDCYFLGPPLPMDGLLYLLVEKNQQIRLICLNRERRNKIKIVADLPLARASRPLWLEPFRRIQAAHLAYGDGVLVCPTNAGLVFGVDPLAGGVMWIYPYREKKGLSPDPSHSWKASAPVVADGKVIYTPPDAGLIFGLRMRDGSLVWSQKKRDDDLYLGGVWQGKLVIVGTTSVRCLSLENGGTLWTAETGTPSGQGIMADGMYYLPLRATPANKRPEICVLDVNKGRISARIASRPRTPGEQDFDVLGNLLFADGNFVSLTPWEIAVYPRLRDRLQEIDGRLGKHPNDPSALMERAMMRRDRGDLNGAIDDLRHALKESLGGSMHQQARERLFDALTERFQRDPRASDPELKEYEELCDTQPDNASENERARSRDERTRRRVRYYLAAARIRAGQGRMRDALQAYLDLAALRPGHELIRFPDDPTVRVRRDILVRDHIVGLLQRTTPEQRRQLEDDILQKLKEVRSRRDAHRLRDFLNWFGDESTAGRDARLALAELLMNQREFLEADLQLQRVLRRRDDPARAARAVEMLARLMLMHGLMPDAVYYYRLLRRDFAAVKLSDGRTGAEVWDALSTDKRLLPYLDASDPFTGAKLKARKEEGSFPDKDPVFQFEQDGENVPFFRRQLVGLSLNQSELRLIDRATGATNWSQRLSSTSIAGLIARVDPNLAPRFLYHTLGHLLVLPVEHQVFGIDPMTRRILWEKDTAPTEQKAVGANLAATAAPRSTLLMTEQDGVTRVQYADGWVQYLGQDLVLSSSALCLTTRRGLQAFDPVSGQLLWQRPDEVGRLRLFGDEEYVFLVKENSDGEAVSTRVFRLADGRTVRALDFADPFVHRLQRFGRTLLLSEKDSQRGVTLRLYDILAGKNVWKQSYRAGSILARSEVAHLAGAVEPDGKVHVVDLRSRRETMTARLAEPSEHLKDVEAIHLLADARHIYLAFRQSSAADVRSNLASESGLRDLPINGRLYAFDRTSGEIDWHILASNQRLVLSRFRELPIVLLTARKKASQKIGGPKAPVNSISSIEKRSGRMLFTDELPSGPPFYAVRFSAEAGTIDFVSPTVKIQHSFAK